jgi:hypothetical protein
MKNAHEKETKNLPKCGIHRSEELRRKLRLGLFRSPFSMSMGNTKDEGRYDRKSAQLQILNSFLSKFS